MKTIFIKRRSGRAFLLLALAAGLGRAAQPSDLFTAIRNGDHSRVKKLLKDGAQPGAADAQGTTALMHSVIESDVEMMRILLDAGAAVNAKNAAGSTALMYAAVNLPKTRLLLNKGADATTRNQRGVSAMDVAVTTVGSTPVLRLLAGKGAKPDDAMMAPAADKGDLEAMQFLLSIGASPGGADSAGVWSAAGARCDACVRLLVEHGAPVTGLNAFHMGTLGQTVKRGLPNIGEYLLAHGASLTVSDREDFTLLMQAVLSMEPQTRRDQTVSWLLAKHVDPNVTNTRGDTAYLLAARLGETSTMDLLAKSGAKPVHEEFPKPAGTDSARDAVLKVLPLLEKSGEAMFRNRGCVSCHNNSLPAMAVALARQKGFSVDEAQAQKELGFAVATDKPYFESMRLGTTIGGQTDTLGYTLMGMAAAGYPADALTDAHINYIATQQLANGSWWTISYRPPSEYSPVSTTAVALRAIQLYPIPGRRAEFTERVARAKKFLLSFQSTSAEERAMRLNGLAWAGATTAERAPAVKAIREAQNADGSWSQVPGIRGDAYATGQALYALHASGGVTTQDPTYQKGTQWLLKNQLADGSWFVPARTAPIQLYFETGFPHGPHQFASDAGSSWSAMALLFTLPDSSASPQ